MIDTEALRSKILDLAIRGKLTEQLPEDGSAEDLYAKIQEEKARLVKEGKIKKEIDLPEITEDEIPYEIPKKWKWCKLGNVFEIVMGQSPNGESINSQEGMEFHQGKIYFGSKCLNKSGKKTIEATKIAKENSVLLCVRAPVGIVNITDREICIGRGLCALTVVTGVELEYLYYYLKTRRKSFELKGTGSTFSAISVDDVKAHAFPFPPLPEQKRIIDKVNDILERIDEIEKLQSQYSTDVEVLKSKLIDAGIRGKLTEQLPEDGDAEDLYNQIQDEKARLIKEGKIKKEKPLPEMPKGKIPFNIPKNWKWVRLGDISAKISSGNTPAGGKNSDAYVENGYCFFREQNIYDDGIREEGLVYITEELLNTRENSTVLPMDILLNITGGSIGRCALVPDNFTKGSINQHILIIRMIDPRLRFYVHKCICSPYVQKYIKGNVVGDKDGFSGGRCKNMLIPLPPIEEQERIVEILEKFLLQF